MSADCLTPVVPEDLTTAEDADDDYHPQLGLTDHYRVPFFSIYQQYQQYSGSKWMKVYQMNDVPNNPMYYIKQYATFVNDVPNLGGNTDPPDSSYDTVFLPHLWNTVLFNTTDGFQCHGDLRVYVKDKDQFALLPLTGKDSSKSPDYDYNVKKLYIIHGNDDPGTLSDSTRIPHNIRDLIVGGTRLYIWFKWDIRTGDNATGKVGDGNQIFYGIYDFVKQNDKWMKVTNAEGKLTEYINYSVTGDDIKDPTSEEKTQLCKELSAFKKHCENAKKFKSMVSSKKSSVLSKTPDVTSKQYTSEDLAKLCEAIIKADSETNKDAIITQIIKIINSQENGAQLNQVICGIGNTLLHLASSKGYVGVVEAILNKGVDINKTNGLTETPLQLAIEKNNVEVVKLLLDRGAKTTVSNYKWSPLHIASFKGYAEIVKLLLEKGANINAKNNEGNTAIEVTKSEEIKKLLTPPGGGDLLKSQSSPSTQSDVKPSIQLVYDPSNKISAQPNVNISTTPPTYIEVIFKDNIPQTVVIVDKPPSEPPTLSAYIETMSFNNADKVVLQLSDEDMKYVLNPIEIMKMPV